MSSARGFRLPPAGDPYGAKAWLRIATRRTSARQLAERLTLRLGAARVQLRCSGRDALRIGLRRAARATGRSEVLIPAYTCLSVPAAAVAAGLRVRLVDVDRHGRIDRQALERSRLDDVAVIVVCNLFGRAEPIDEIRSLASAAGAWVLDDAAQAFGAHAIAERGRPVGARGELGVLSFGRGKPLSGLGGGALVVGHACASDDEAKRSGGEGDGGDGGDVGDGAEVDPAASPMRAIAKAIAWDAALQPGVFSLLAKIPALGIGETPFDPEFARGAIDAASIVLADDALDHAAEAAARRGGEAFRLAETLHARTRFEAILPGSGEHGVMPRLAVLAPDDATRASAVAGLARVGAGASALYPAALSRVAKLRPHRTDAEAMPGAERLAARLFTLPVNGSLRGSRAQQTFDLLATL